MTSRAEYRTDLNSKLVGLDDSGYGDFEFSDSELDVYLDLAVARLFPAIYERLVEEALTLTSYGSSSTYGYCEPAFPDRVFMIEDPDELEPLFGWAPRPTRIVKIDMTDVTAVNAYYYDAYSLPSDDDTDAAIPEIYRPLIVLGALVEALEARQDSGVRGDASPVGNMVEVPLLDRLIARYDSVKNDLAMSLPVAMV